MSQMTDDNLRSMLVRELALFHRKKGVTAREIAEGILENPANQNSLAFDMAARVEAVLPELLDDQVEQTAERGRYRYKPPRHQAKGR